jgi:diacylglycerol kinase family enzyme
LTQNQNPSQNQKPKKLHLIANSRSGKGYGETLHEIAKQICSELGVEFVEYDTSAEGALEAEAKRAVDAAEKDGGVVVAAGGDGTIRGVAQIAKGRAVKFAVVACGTFNFFARNHAIPDDHAEAVRVALTGEPRPVRLGEINGEVFLINASLGLYAKAIQDREKRTSRYGRNRAVVIASTFASFLSKHRLLDVQMSSENVTKNLKTPMIFIGNNALQLRDLAFDVAKCMKKNMLAVVTLKPLTKPEIARVFWRGIMKTIEKEERVDSFCVDELTIHTRKLHQTVALDGEMFKMISPLHVKAVPNALMMMLPPKETAAP